MKDSKYHCCIYSIARGKGLNLNPVSDVWWEYWESPPESLSAFPPSHFSAVKKGEGNPCRNQDHSWFSPPYQPKAWTSCPVTWSHQPDLHPASWRKDQHFTEPMFACGVFLTVFQQPLDCQVHRPLIDTSSSLRGFIQRNLHQETGGSALRVAWECRVGTLSQRHLRIVSCPSSSPLPTHSASSALGWVSATLGRGLNRLDPPPSISPGSAWGLGLLALAPELKQTSHMMLRQHVGKCEYDKRHWSSLPGVWEPRPCSAG